MFGLAMLSSDKFMSCFIRKLSGSNGIFPRSVSFKQ